MPLRLLHIIPTLDRAGTGRQLALLAAHLPREEFDVHICALTRGGPLLADFEDAGIPAITIGKRWPVDPLALWKLRRHIADLRPDVVHTWLFESGVYGRIAASTLSVPAILHHERCVISRKGRVRWWIDRCLAGRTSRLIVNSRVIREDQIAHHLPSQKIAVVPVGIPTPRPTDVTRQELLRTLRLPDNARLIGAVGRLGPRKRVKDFIWTIELVAVLHPSVHLIVLGDGPQRYELQRYAALASRPSRVRFLGQRDDLWRILPHFDVLWNGSGDEGPSYAVLEAMAAGIPVVATDLPGNRDLVVAGETGFLMPVAGRAEFARATHSILSDEQLATKLGKCGSQRARSHFPIEKTIAAYVQICREVTGTSAQAAKD